jgi:hypothetical protein
MLFANQELKYLTYPSGPNSCTPCYVISIFHVICVINSIIPISIFSRSVKITDHIQQLYNQGCAGNLLHQQHTFYFPFCHLEVGTCKMYRYVDIRVSIYRYWFIASIVSYFLCRYQRARIIYRNEHGARASPLRHIPP